MTKEIPIACRPNSWNSTNENIWLAFFTSITASGKYHGSEWDTADRWCLRFMNRKWAGPLDGAYSSKDTLSEEEDSIAGALARYTRLMEIQDREFAQQQAARERFAQEKADALTAEREAMAAKALPVVE